MTVYEKAADGKLTKVDSWTSVAGTTHDFGSKLTAGTTYVLREETAPDGYTAISDTEFTIAKDGTVTTTLTMTKDADGNFIYLVQDKPETTPTATPTPPEKTPTPTPKTTTVTPTPKAVTTSTPTTTKAAKTSDDSMPAIYWLLLIDAAAAIAIAALMKKRSQG